MSFLKNDKLRKDTEKLINGILKVKKTSTIIENSIFNYSVLLSLDI